jgi:hypothetical protein
MHKVHVSLFNGHHFLPTRFAPLELEMSLSSNPADWLRTGADGLSAGYTVTNIQLLYDQIQLDDSIEEALYKGLLANHTLSMPMLYVSQMVVPIPVGATTFSFSAVRAFSKLSKVWVTFRGTGGKSSEFLCPLNGNQTGLSPVMAGDFSPTVRLSLGPLNLPNPSPASTIPELFYQLQQALPNIPNMDRDTFIAKGFTIVFDLQKIYDDPTTSASTRSGDLLRVDLQNLTLAPANVPSEVYLTLFAFSVCVQFRNKA